MQEPELPSAHKPDFLQRIQAALQRCTGFFLSLNIAPLSAKYKLSDATNHKGAQDYVVKQKTVAGRLRRITVRVVLSAPSKEQMFFNQLPGCQLLICVIVLWNAGLSRSPL
jgi:hypothetical protein